MAAEQAQRFPPEILAALIKQGAITTEDMKKMHPADIIQVIKATNENPKEDAAIKDSRDSMLSSPMMPPGVVKPIAALGSGWEGASIPQGAAKLWNGVAPTAGAATGAAVAAKTGLPWWVGSLIGGGLGNKLRFGSGWTKGAPAAAAEAPKWPISVEAKVDPESMILNNAPRPNVIEKGNLIKPGPDASNFKIGVNEQNLRMNPQTGQKFAGDSPSKTNFPGLGDEQNLRLNPQPGQRFAGDSPKPASSSLDLKIRDTANEAASMDLPLKPKSGPSNFAREEFPAGTNSKSSSKDFIAAANDSAEKQGAQVKPGERSVESIQEEISKLLEKATSKRRSPK